MRKKNYILKILMTFDCHLKFLFKQKILNSFFKYINLNQLNLITMGNND